MSSTSATNRRSFLARGAALAAVPAVATLVGGALAEPAFADTVPAADTLPDYAPIPPSALGPAVNAQGYYVGRVQIASANGVSNKVTHIVYSHHHADHLGASSLFGGDVVRVGHVETKRLLARDNDPTRPVPDLTFATHRTLRVGGERIELAWHGTNHTPDNIYVHFPDHDTLMLVDVNLPGWVPFANFNISEDVPGTIAVPGKALAYPWKHFIGGHMGRLGTRDDMIVYQQYVTDIIDNVKKALVTVDPTPFFTKYGNNVWAAVKTYQDAQVNYAAAPVIQKYTGVLAAADVYTASTAFIILESIRLDLGIGSQVHP